MNDQLDTLKFVRDYVLSEADVDSDAGFVLALISGSLIGLVEWMERTGKSLCEHPAYADVQAWRDAGGGPDEQG